MSESIIVALITGILALIGTYFSNRKSAALLEYRLAELEKKVDKHNQIVERTYHLEEDIALIQAEDKRQNTRIEKLENKEIRQ